MSMALSLVLLASCMPAKQPQQWLKDKELVVQSLQDAHIKNTKLQESIEALDHRILALEHASAQQEAKLSAVALSFEAEKAFIKPRLAKKNTSRKETKLLNKRLDALSAKLNPSVNKPVDVAAPALAEKNAYTAAYLALKSGRYDESSAGFSAVVKEHPKGEYTDQAYYWLGESLVAQHLSKKAIKAFMVVAKKYPDSPKHAASLLKIAAVYKGLNKLGDARAALKRVIKEHPDSRSAERARVQLAALGKSSGAKK